MPNVLITNGPPPGGYRTEGPPPMVSDLLNSLAEMRARFGDPEPEHVIITPSMEALEAAVPMVRHAKNPGHPFIGLRVFVCPFAPRAMLVPLDVVKRNPNLAATPYFRLNPPAAMGGHGEGEADTPTVVGPD